MIVKGISILGISIKIGLFLITTGWIVIGNLVVGFQVEKILSFILLVSLLITVLLINKMRKDKYFLHKLRIRQRGVILIVIILTTVAFIILRCIQPVASDPPFTNERYFLSAMSQGIAALFALVFTISLIVLQISYKHKGILAEFLGDPLIIIYPIICGTSIFLPLFILRNGSFIFWSDIALICGFVSIVLVIPFFLRMKDFLKYNIGIREDLLYAKQLIDQTDFDFYKNYLYEILLLSTQAAEQQNFVVVKTAVGRLIDLCIYSCGQYKSKAREIILHTVIQCCILVQLANRWGVLKDIWHTMIKLSDITDSIVQLDREAFDRLTMMFSEQIEISKDTFMKELTASSVWVLCAKWYVKNPNEEASVRAQIEALAKRHGKQFILSVNDRSGKHDDYANAMWRLQYGDEARALITMRSWITSKS